MTVDSPYTRDELLGAFDGQQAENLAYWGAFDTESFFRRIDGSWSPAETVRHLVKSTRPVVKALGTPRIVLRLRFGKPTRASMPYEEFREHYLRALEAGGQAGRFAPSARVVTDMEAWRAAILDSLRRVNLDLRWQITRWPEATLDARQLPHPLVGMITVREMLFFTLYHQRHHIAVVERRLEDTRGRAGVERGCP